jgi:uncharacterized protein DUF6603
VPDQPGSLERLAGELGNVLGRLAALLGPDQVLDTLAQFGVAFPTQLLAHPGFAAAQRTTTTAAQDLGSATGQLATAIESGDVGQIVAQGVRVLEGAGRVIASFDDLKAQLQAAGPTMPGVTAAQIADLTNEFPGKLLDFVVTEGLDIVPAVGATLALLGLVDRTYHPADPANPTSVAFETARLRFDRLGPALKSPEQHFSDLYQWGSNAFDGQLLLPAVSDLVARLGLPTRYQPPAGGQPARVEAFAFDLTPAAGSPPGLAVDVVLPVRGGIDRDLQLPHSDWKAHLKLTATVAVGASGTITPPLSVTLRPPSGQIQGDAELTIEGKPPSPFVLVGAAGGSRLEVAEVDAGLGFDIAWDTSAGQAAIDPHASAQVKGGRLVIDTSDADGFIAKLVSGWGIDAHFETGLAWSAATGVQFTGSSTLEIGLPVHIAIGPLEIPSLYLVLGFESGGFPLELSADLKASLGPLVAVINRIGARATLTFPAGGGNVGPAQLAFAFKPPTGAGLSVDAGIVTGGGFLSIDADRGEYAGILQLEIAGLVGVTAIGLITTKNPDGTPGFSLLIVLTADFGPGIQLGFGFTLNAVGGLLGLNRTMLFSALMDGVRSGSIDSIMFPRDVIANAPRIISDLRAIFPPHEGTFLVGPMAKLGWGEPTLVSLSLGVIIEIPPGDIAILGVLRIALPADQLAILVLQVNFAGALEFSKSRLYFFASLFDSHLLFITIQGEMGVLFAWGDDANFVLSIGGFHPQFTPPPLPFPAPRRIQVDVINESYARIRCDGYFAVTTNTVQFGSHSEMYFGLSALSVEGHSGFDALIQFSPFHFIVEISTSFSVKVFGVGVFGLDIDLSLEGPTPWHAHGTASISLLFFSIGVNVDFTFGDARDTTLPPVAVMPIVAGELGKRSNWKAQLPSGSNLLVSLRKLDPAEAELVLHPVGALQVNQRSVPLDLKLDKFGSQKPSDANRFALTTTSPALAKTRDLRESFAPAQFKDGDDASKLSEPAYSPQDSGIELAPSGKLYDAATAITRIVRYDLTIIDTKLQPKRQRFFLYPGALFEHWLGGASVARSTLSAYRDGLTHPYDGTVEVTHETYAVAHAADNALLHPEAGAFASRVAAREYLDRAVAADPGLAGTLHVLPEFELAA